MIKQFILPLLLITGIALISIDLMGAAGNFTTFCQWLAYSSAFIISIFTADFSLTTDVLRWSSGNEFALRVTEACSALDLCAIWVAGVLSYPVARWHIRVMVAMLGVVLIQVLNILRLVTLFFAGAWWPEQFHWIHEHLWPVFLSLDLVLLFVLYLRYIDKHYPVPRDEAFEVA